MESPRVVIESCLVKVAKGKGEEIDYEIYNKEGLASVAVGDGVLSPDQLTSKSTAFLQSQLPVSSSAKASFGIASSIMTADDKTKALDSCLPDSYKGSFAAASSIYDKAQELKK